MKFISPKSDFCLKELFENEIVRRHFISDVLSIPITDIKSVRLSNTFLRRMYRKQKLGILDVLVELNNNTKINIEIQLTLYKHWHKRQLFYLSKLYTADLLAGQDYSKLKKCISISILDFNLTEREEYHSIYRLRDEQGHEFSDVLEVHVIELRKKLTGSGAIEDWIRFFNAKSKEELDMIKTERIGIREAIQEVKRINFIERIRIRHEYRLKAIRDHNAMMETAYDSGVEKGHSEGLEEGKQVGVEQGIQAVISFGIEDGKSEEEIVKRLVQRFRLSKEIAKQKYEEYK